MAMNTSVHIDGEAIKGLREKKNLTQLYLATVVGVTTDTISRWENRRYPSIKLENARKVADALEVPLEDILQKDAARKTPAPADTLTDIPKDTVAGDDLPPWSTWLPDLRHAAYWVVCLTILAMGAILVGYFDSRSTMKIVAERVVPNHAAISGPFPVAIRVHVEEGKDVPVLVREKLVCDCQAFETAKNGERPFGKNPRWIGTTSGGYAFFVYLVKPSADAAAGQVLLSGETLLRSGKRKVVHTSGPDRVELVPFHWADRNRDYRISDEEILLAYDTFSFVAGEPGFLDEVERLWLAGGYSWDAAGQKIVVQEEKKTEKNGDAP